jgi:hypothetical protein
MNYRAFICADNLSKGELEKLRDLMILSNVIRVRRRQSTTHLNARLVGGEPVPAAIGLPPSGDHIHLMPHRHQAPRDLSYEHVPPGMDGV